MSQQLVCETKVDPANGATGRHHRVPERAKRMTAVTGFSLEPHGITVADVRRNLPPSQLYEEAIRHDPTHVHRRQRGPGRLFRRARPAARPRTSASSSSPTSESDVWWGPVNVPLDAHAFQINRERAKDYLNTRDRLYCVDGFAGWDPEYRVKVRVICSRPYHALFMHNMLIRPTREELADFGEPDYVIYNAGAVPRQPAHRRA